MRITLQPKAEQELREIANKMNCSPTHVMNRLISIELESLNQQQERDKAARTNNETLKSNKQ